MTPPQRDAEYATHVEGWLARAAEGLTTPQLAALGATALRAVWRCAHYTLSEVTLDAVMDRVFYSGRDEYPGLALLDRDRTAGGRPSPDPNQVSPKQARAALAYFFTQFLIIIGNLTADLVTPSLKAELSRVTYGKEGNNP